MQSPQYYHHSFSYGDDEDHHYHDAHNQNIRTPPPPLLSSATSKPEERTPYTALFEKNRGQHNNKPRNSSPTTRATKTNSNNAKRSSSSKVEPIDENFLLFPQRPTPIYNNPIATVGSAEKEYNRKYNRGGSKTIVDARTPTGQTSSSTNGTSPIPFQPSISPYMGGNNNYSAYNKQQHQPQRNSSSSSSVPLKSPALRHQASSAHPEVLDQQQKNTTVLSTAGRFGASVDEQGILQARFVAPISDEQRDKFVRKNRGETDQLVGVGIHEKERLNFIRRAEENYRHSPTYRREFQPVQNYASDYQRAVGSPELQTMMSDNNNNKSTDRENSSNKWYRTQKDRPESPSPVSRVHQNYNNVASSSSIPRVNSRLLNSSTQHEIVRSTSTPKKQTRRQSQQQFNNEEEFVVRGSNSQSASARMSEMKRREAQQRRKEEQEENKNVEENRMPTTPRSIKQLPVPVTPTQHHHHRQSSERYTTSVEEIEKQLIRTRSTGRRTPNGSSTMKTADRQQQQHQKRSTSRSAVVTSSARNQQRRIITQNNNSEHMSPIPFVYADDNQQNNDDPKSNNNIHQNDHSYYTDVVESISQQQEDITPRKQIVSPPRTPRRSSNSKNYSPARLMSSQNDTTVNTSASSSTVNRHHRTTPTSALKRTNSNFSNTSVNNDFVTVKENRSSTLRRQATEERNRTPTPTPKQRILDDFRNNNSARNSALRQRRSVSVRHQIAARKSASRPLSPQEEQQHQQMSPRSSSTRGVRSPVCRISSSPTSHHYQTNRLNNNNLYKNEHFSPDPQQQQQQITTTRFISTTATKNVQTPSRPVSSKKTVTPPFVVSPIKKPRASSPPSAAFQKRQALHEKRQAEISEQEKYNKLSIAQKEKLKEKQLALPWTQMVQSAKREGFSESDLIRLSWASLKGLLDHFGIVHPVQVAQIQISWTRKREKLSLDTKMKVFSSSTSRSGSTAASSSIAKRRAKSVTFAAANNQRQQQHVDPAVLMFPVQDSKKKEVEVDLHQHMPRGGKAPRQF